MSSIGPVTSSGGTVSVTGGTLTLSSPYTQIGSTTHVGNGATLAVPAGMSMAAGLLTGTSRLSFRFKPCGALP